VVFLELALYGIRNFTQLTRLAFKPGLNLIQGGNGSGKSTVSDIAFAVVSPVSETPAESLSPQKTSNICQAALIFKAKNGRIHRLIRDFNSRKSSLAELDASNKFHVTTQDEEPIAKFLAEETGGLSRNMLEGLFSMKAAWMPSARAAEAVRPSPASSAPVPTPSFASPAETKTVPQDHAKKQKRLAELKGLLAQGDQLAAMEDQLSDLQSRSAEAKRRLRMATEKTAELARLAQQGEAFEPLKKLPEDYHLVLETSAQQEQLRNDQLTAIAEDEESLKQDLLGIPGQPIFLNKYFIAGGVLTLTALVLLSALSLEGLYPQLLMVVLLAGVGLMGYAGFLDFGKLNKRRGIEKKIREADRQRLRADAAFKKENASCVELLKKTGSADVAGLKEKIKDYELFRSARRQLETERNQFLGRKTIEELQQDVETVVGQMAQIESKLKASSSLPSDIYLIQEEVRILERDLAAPPSTGPLSDLDPFSTTVVEGGLTLADRSSRFLSLPLRTGLQAAPVNSVLRGHLSDLKTQMTRLTGKLGVRPETEMSLNEELMPELFSPTKAPIPWELLSSGQRDIYHLAYQLAIAQILSRSHPFPLVLDNPLPVLDLPHLQMVLDILREIAQNRQVLLLSSASTPNREGDHLIQLT
jgi:energy-coupling factor transporter ATP-binding protein EcfA2